MENYCYVIDQVITRSYIVTAENEKEAYQKMKRYSESYDCADDMTQADNVRYKIKHYRMVDDFTSFADSNEDGITCVY